VPAAGGVEVAFSLEMKKGVHIGRCNQYDVAAVTAVSSVRASPGYILFPPETDASIPARTSFNKYLYLVNEHVYPE
jgi:hypothetical protein